MRAMTTDEAKMSDLLVDLALAEDAHRANVDEANAIQLRVRDSGLTMDAARRAVAEHQRLMVGKIRQGWQPND